MDNYEKAKIVKKLEKPVDVCTDSVTEAFLQLMLGPKVERKAVSWSSKVKDNSGKKSKLKRKGKNKKSNIDTGKNLLVVCGAFYLTPMVLILRVSIHQLL